MKPPEELITEQDIVLLNEIGVRFYREGYSKLTIEFSLENFFHPDIKTV